jgi:hypothetical protein
VPDGFDQTIDRWMDINAFTNLQPFTYGNCPYNNVRGAGFKSMNMSLFRTIPWGDKRLEFRLETFNLFNWVSYDFPAANVANPAAFGRITSTLGTPREVQLAVKVYF